MGGRVRGCHGGDGGVGEPVARGRPAVGPMPLDRERQVRLPVLSGGGRHLRRGPRRGLQRPSRRLSQPRDELRLLRGKGIQAVQRRLLQRLVGLHRGQRRAPTAGSTPCTPPAAATTAISPAFRHAGPRTAIRPAALLPRPRPRPRRHPARCHARRAAGTTPAAGTSPATESRAERRSSAPRRRSSAICTRGTTGSSASSREPSAPVARITTTGTAGRCLTTRATAGPTRCTRRAGPTTASSPTRPIATARTGHPR